MLQAQQRRRSAGPAAAGETLVGALVGLLAVMALLMKWLIEYQVTTAAERRAQDGSSCRGGTLLRTEIECRDQRVSQSPGSQKQSGQLGLDYFTVGHSIERQLPISKASAWHERTVISWTTTP